MEPNKSVKSLLYKSQFDDANILEIGIDEAGRGPLFGPVFAAAVILPKDDSFDHSKMKDSKKFHSKKKIQEVANYIKENAIAWSVCYESEKTIDDINILQATQKAMHSCIKEITNTKLLKPSINCDTIRYNSSHLLIDGNYFVPIHLMAKQEWWFLKLQFYIFYRYLHEKQKVVNLTCQYTEQK